MLILERSTNFVREKGYCTLGAALVLLILAIVGGKAQDFTYTNTNGTITITGYYGSGGAVTIPSTIQGLPVTSIGASAFYGFTNLTSLTVADSVTNIGPHAFDYSLSLYSLNLGNGVTTIGDYAFRFCLNLTNVIVPDSVTSIGEEAFGGGLVIISLGKGVTNIGLHAFSSVYGNGKAAINVDPLNPVYSSLEGVLFDKAQTKLIACPNGRAGNYAVPGSVTSIEAEAFLYCGYLANITMADGVTNIGASAFAGCSSLTAFRISDRLTTIPNSAFADCAALAALRIPDSVTTIQSNAFLQCYSLTELIMGSNIVSIGEHAFELCHSLKSVTFPRSLVSLGQYAFANGLDLSAAYFNGNAPVADCTTFINYGIFSARPNTVTAYYLPGTTGWGPTFACVPARLWNPWAQAGDASFGVQQNRFGLNITGTPGIPLVVEACTNLAAQSWVPLQSCTLTNGLIYFSDSQWTNYPGRFYRIRSP